MPGKPIEGKVEVEGEVKKTRPKLRPGE